MEEDTVQAVTGGVPCYWPRRSGCVLPRFDAATFIARQSLCRRRFMSIAQHRCTRSDACVLSCFDYWFELAMRKFFRRCGLEAVDHIKVSGSAKALAAPETDRDFVLGMTRTAAQVGAHADSRAQRMRSLCGSLALAGGGRRRRGEGSRDRESGAGVEGGVLFRDLDGVYCVG
jgi:hypothetical protein